MADMLHAASSVLFALSAIFTVLSAAIYIRQDLYSYRQLIRNSGKSRKKLTVKKKQRHAKNTENAAVRVKKVRPGSEEKRAPAEADDRKKEKSLPEIFTMRVIKSGGGRKKEGAGKTQELGRADERDTVVLQDGSDDTKLLNKDVSPAGKEEPDQDLWMRPARIFRETEGVIVIHMDRSVEGKKLK